MTNHPNRGRSNLETVAQYVFRQSDPAMQSVTLADVRDRLTDSDTITGFEVQPSEVGHYQIDSGEIERCHRPVRDGDHVHLFEVVALVDGGAYGLSREGVATFGADQRPAANRLVKQLNEALAAQ